MTPGYAHVAVSDTGYWIIDISDPAHPFVASRTTAYDRNYQVVVSGDYAYLACRNAGLQVVDIRDPLRPRTVGRLPVSANSRDLVVREKWLLSTTTGSGSAQWTSGILKTPSARKYCFHSGVGRSGSISTVRSSMPRPPGKD